MRCPHIHSIRFYLGVAKGTVEDECVLLAHCDCDNALADVDEAAFFSVFEAPSPSGEVATLKDGWGFLRTLA